MVLTGSPLTARCLRRLGRGIGLLHRRVQTGLLTLRALCRKRGRGRGHEASDGSAGLDEGGEGIEEGSQRAFKRQRLQSHVQAWSAASASPPALGSAPYSVAPMAAPTAAQPAPLAADAALKLPNTFNAGSSSHAARYDFWAQLGPYSSVVARRGGAGESGQRAPRGGDASVLKALRAAATGHLRPAAASSEQLVQVQLDNGSGEGAEEGFPRAFKSQQHVIDVHAWAANPAPALSASPASASQPASGIGLQEVDATVGPVMECMGSAPLTPFQMRRTAAGPTPRVLQLTGAVMHPTAKDVGLMDAHVLKHDEAVHEGALCSPHHMGNTAGALAAEQSQPPPPPGTFASPQPGASPVLLPALEQEPSVDTLQPKDRAAEPEAEPAGAVALPTTPAGPAAESMGSPPKRPYWRTGSAGVSTQGVPKPAGVLMHPTAEARQYMRRLCTAHPTQVPWAAEQSYPLPTLDASSQPTPLPTTQPGASPVLLAALEQEPSVDTLQPVPSSAEANAAGAVAPHTIPASLASRRSGDDAGYMGGEFSYSGGKDDHSASGGDGACSGGSRREGVYSGILKAHAATTTAATTTAATTTAATTTAATTTAGTTTAATVAAATTAAGTTAVASDRADAARFHPTIVTGPGDCSGNGSGAFYVVDLTVSFTEHHRRLKLLEAQRAAKGGMGGRGGGVRAAHPAAKVNAKGKGRKVFVEKAAPEAGSASHRVGLIPIASPSGDAAAQAGNNVHVGRRQVNLECDDPVPDADMEEDEYADSSLAPPSTPGAAYVPAFASANPSSAHADPTLQAFRSSQHADPGMSSGPPQSTRYHRQAHVSEEGTLGPIVLSFAEPADYPGAESGCAHQPSGDKERHRSQGGRKRRNTEGAEGQKRRCLSRGTAETAQHGSHRQEAGRQLGSHLQQRELNWLGNDALDAAAKKFAAKESTDVAIHAAAAETSVGDTVQAGRTDAASAALAEPSALATMFAGSSYGSAAVHAAVCESPIRSSYQFAF